MLCYERFGVTVRLRKCHWICNPVWGSMGTEICGCECDGSNEDWVSRSSYDVGNDWQSRKTNKPCKNTLG